VKPLNGIKVLDLSRVLAGPLCAQTLGDLGAEVIKIETPGQGDESRSWPPFHNGTATAFITANRNKKSIAVNLKEPAGQRILHQLAAEVDIVIESAATGVSGRLAADYATLSAINDRLIYCTISGFGRSGPLKDARGYDMILQAYSGMMSVTGDENSSAVRIPFSPIDQTTGYHAVIGVLAALIERSVSGRGGLVEVSLFETALSFLGYMIQAYLEDGKLPTRSGSRHGGIAPYQAFQCADRTVLIGIANDKLWRSFCNAFGATHLAHDPRFATNKERVRHREEVVGVVQSIVAGMTSRDLLRRLDEIGVPCAPINSLQDIIDDPQTVARGLLKAIGGDSGIGGMQAVVMPILFNDQERELGTPPPGLGEHSDLVLGQLGYSPEEIARLEADGVIGRRPA
jgi:formyl-CoA transferase